MKIHIDFSVFSEDGKSLGHVSGDIEVPKSPQIGELLEISVNAGPGQNIGIPSALIVEDVVHPSTKVGADLMVALQSVTIDKALPLETMDSVIEHQMGFCWNPHDL